MLDFTVRTERCIRCGLCVTDCPASIITLADNEYPVIAPEKEASCYRCQHCFTICPTAAVSIFGLEPESGMQIPDAFPRPEQLEALIKGRRAVRHYLDENLPQELINHLLTVAWHAPSGMNNRQVLFTVIDDREQMNQFRQQVMQNLAKLVNSNILPEGLGFFGGFVKLWEEKGIDSIFRGAPHFLVASAPRTTVSPIQDTMIALSYFDLFAQANGVGTVWDGLAKWLIDDLLPTTRLTLGIPDDHQIGYSMAFGRPAHQYARTACHEPARISRYRG